MTSTVDSLHLFQALSELGFSNAQTTWKQSEMTINNQKDAERMSENKEEKRNLTKLYKSKETIECWKGH